MRPQDVNAIRGSYCRSFRLHSVAVPAMTASQQRKPAAAMTPTDRIASKIAQANAAAAAIINAGQTIKAKAKEANELLGRAYSAITDRHNDQVRTEEASIRPDSSVTEADAWADYWTRLDARRLPFDLHQVRETKHRAAAESTGAWEAIAALVATRQAVKDVPIITREPKGPTLEATIKARVLKTFQETLADHRATFEWAKQVIAAAEAENPGFKRLPISINHVYCENQHGTSWLRIDWYLRGHRTPFQAIVAAIDAVEREAA